MHEWCTVYGRRVERIYGKSGVSDAIRVSFRLFSDLGLVGVIGIENGKIDLFSLSCRALGRNIEKDMIKYAVKAGAKSVTVNKTEKMKSSSDCSIFWD